MAGRYEEWTKRYAQTPQSDLPWEYGKPKEVVVALCKSGLIPKGGRVLDMGCGAGSNTAYMASAGFNVVALDIVERALVYTRENSLPEKPQILMANVAMLPLKDSIFDLVLDFGCFHCLRIEDRLACIEGVRRVLKPGGFFYLTCCDAGNESLPVDVSQFSEEELRSSLSRFFNIVDLKSYGAKNKSDVARKFHTLLMVK